MALDHALLVALSEEPASGTALARRFEKSIGFFWHATHQQIYRVLGRMEQDGWVEASELHEPGKPTQRQYAVTQAGAEALATWLAEPTAAHALRSELAVKLRGASFGDVEAVLGVVRANLADHRTRLDHYEGLMRRDYPDPDALEGLALDHYLVLRGGILTEQTWVTWLTEYLARRTPSTHPPEAP